ncbi:MAG: acetyl-CoA decarbonylase/synthase complex subunit alpha/beta [Candidatus Omnitrophota bacterium]|nr:acetyl-CoA decarbonylase/synthase complex subunit alpha/beta [Candidatus Omnitrophota bacterium]
MTTESDKQLQCDFRRKSIIGARMAVEAASSLLQQACLRKGKDAAVEFPDTAFYLPLINAFLNRDVKNTNQLPEILAIAKSFISEDNDLNKAFDSGVATLIASEVIEAIKYLDGNPYTDGWQGFIPDSVYRSLGLVLVDGRMPAIAVILGSAPDNKTATNLIRELQSKNILSLLVGKSKEVTFKNQLEEEKVSLGLDSYVVPLGPNTTALIYAANFIARVAVSFGGVKKGDVGGLLKYTKERVQAFVICLGELDPLKVSALSAIMKLGLPVITDQVISHSKDCQEIIKRLLVTEKDYSNMVSRAIQMRGIKIKVDKIDIPVNYSAAFEGERIRKEQMYVEFGAGKSPAFEYVRQKEMDEIKDGKILLIGPDIDQMQEAKAYPLGIIVEVAGKKMESDFEPVLERQIHRFLNYAMGVFHIGQRDMNWIRISKDAQKAGLKIRDFGKILHAKFHNEYGEIVDKVAITLLTTEEQIKQILPEVKDAYNKRDERIGQLKDDTVDKFYSCSLCTSFAPNHICVISPERMGLCGAISWLDAKASFEISPIGGNIPIERKTCLDTTKGVWEGVNEFVFNNSNKTIERLCLYSLMDSPMSACGCFECVAAVMPEANGVIIVNREYDGMTPIGMKFTTLAGTVGGGKQTPGFMGIAKRYIASKRFISAEGGLKRVVWMPKGLKEAIKAQFAERAKEIGIPDFIDKIADETICTEVQELLDFLEKVKHPVLSLEPLL